MDNKPSQSNKNRFLKLSLKKNRVKDVETRKESKQTSDVIIDESFDRLQMEFTNRIQPQKLNTPIVIDDSCELSECEELSNIKPSSNEPSKAGNISLNLSSKEIAASPQESRPCIGGWSPAQHFICATPKHDPTPSTPKDVVNESLEQCSIKKIQQSQIKLLNELYGDTWKTIPKLFKNASDNKDKFDCVSKKLFVDDDDSDKENIKSDLKREKLLYLTGSDAKHKSGTDSSHTDRKCRKKLYTEKIPHTPDLPKTKLKTDRAVNSTTKKLKGLTVTELVKVKKNEVEKLIKRVGNVSLESSKASCKRLSFVGSLADNVPSGRCHPEAIQYIDSFKTLKERLARRLYTEFNKVVFSDLLDKDLPIIWEPKLRRTAGTTTNRLIKTANGSRIRTSSIKLSTKVVDGPQRLRDTLIHELCHAATWLIDGELRAGHGPLWKKWVADALREFPELGEISRCHNMDIHFKYCYRCTDCGYRIQRHTKSIDVTEKCCGYCRGKFEVILNKKNKDGVVVSTPARNRTPNQFALYVKENYGTLKDGRTHAQVMKLLGEQFSARKKVPDENVSDSNI